jgi:phosphohistidine phosphatase
VIYLIRHASAATGEPRRLTKLGRREAREAGDALRKRGARIAIILASPLARARETADLIAREFTPPPAVEERDVLAGGASPEEIIREIAVPGGELALVGHQPDLGVCVAHLLGREIHFHPSSICCLEFAPPSTTRLLWVRHPLPPTHDAT